MPAQMMMMIQKGMFHSIDEIMFLQVIQVIQMIHRTRLVDGE